MRKNLKIIVIVLIIKIIFSILSFFLKGERPDDLYRKMKNLHDNQTLIGLSKEEVIELLGQPEYESNWHETTFYQYDAGSLDKGLFWENRTIIFKRSYGWKFNVAFYKNDKVKSTSMQMVD